MFQNVVGVESFQTKQQNLKQVHSFFSNWAVSRRSAVFGYIDRDSQKETGTSRQIDRNSSSHSTLGSELDCSRSELGSATRQIIEKVLNRSENISCTDALALLKRNGSVATLELLIDSFQKNDSLLKQLLRENSYRVEVVTDLLKPSKGASLGESIFCNNCSKIIVSDNRCTLSAYDTLMIRGGDSVNLQKLIQLGCLPGLGTPVSGEFIEHYLKTEENREEQELFSILRNNYYYPSELRAQRLAFALCHNNSGLSIRHMGMLLLRRLDEVRAKLESYCDSDSTDKNAPEHLLALDHVSNVVIDLLQYRLSKETFDFTWFEHIQSDQLRTLVRWAGELCKVNSYIPIDGRLCDSLAGWIKKENFEECHEVMAGTGQLAEALSFRGIHIHPTDSHRYFERYSQEARSWLNPNVIKQTASDAVQQQAAQKQHGKKLLMVAAPPTDPQTVAELREGIRCWLALYPGNCALLMGTQGTAEALLESSGLIAEYAPFQPYSHEPESQVAIVIKSVEKS